jgi:hypothetical protein
MAIWHLAKFFIWVGLAIFFAYMIYHSLVIVPQEQAKIDQDYQRQTERLERDYCSDPQQAAYDPAICNKYK